MPNNFLDPSTNVGQICWKCGNIPNKVVRELILIASNENKHNLIHLAKPKATKTVFSPKRRHFCFT